MNDALLSQRLRELCEPPPANGFEQRLRVALAREARDFTAPAPAGRAPRRRARPWLGRAVTLAVAFGASAAAAAAGWVSWPSRGEAGKSSTSASAEESPDRRPLPSRASPVEVERPAPAEVQEPPVPPNSATAPYADPASPASSPGAASRASEARAKRSLMAPPVSSGASERRTRSSQEPPLVKSREASPAIVPFELPGVDLSGAAAAKPPAPRGDRAESSDRRAPRVGRRHVERPRPQLEHGPPDRSERGKSETLRERGRAREARGAENAERGLERARAARERNGK